MTRFQLVFRRTGSDDESEFRYNNDEGAPHIDGTIIVDGDRYAIRGVEWLVRREDHHGDDMARFICTLVVEPDDDLP